MRAIKKELPALIVTLQQLYQATGDAEAFGLSALLSSYAVVSGIIFLAEVLDICGDSPQKKEEGEGER